MWLVLIRGNPYQCSNLQCQLMWLQLFVLGLPIIPGSVDWYLQAKVKQYIINPIANFFYLPWWTIEDIQWITNCICDPFIWLYTYITHIWEIVIQFLWHNLQAAVIYVWQDIVLFFIIMWFIFKLAVLAIFSGLTIYLVVIIYRLFSRRDFVLQCEYYFGPTPPPGQN